MAAAALAVPALAKLGVAKGLLGQLYEVQQALLNSSKAIGGATAAKAAH